MPSGISSLGRHVHSSADIRSKNGHLVVERQLGVEWAREVLSILGQGLEVGMEGTEVGEVGEGIRELVVLGADVELLEQLPQVEVGRGGLGADEEGVVPSLCVVRRSSAQLQSVCSCYACLQLPRERET